jgi:hypothetical protein
MPFKYYAKKDNQMCASIALDPYNKDGDSKISFIEGKVRKDSDDCITLFMFANSTSNVVKNVKGNDGKWGVDPNFTFETQIVSITLHLKPWERTYNGESKTVTPSEVESFLATYLLEFWSDKPFEGEIDFSADTTTIKKYLEYRAIDDNKARQRAQDYLDDICKLVEIDYLHGLTPDIMQVTASSNSGAGGGFKKGGYTPAETEAQKLASRSEYVKRFLADNWDETVDYKAISFDSCLALYQGRLSTLGKDNHAMLLEVLNAILK